MNKNLSLVLEGNQLIRKQEVKFLGVYLNENLPWKSHINHVCKKISKSIAHWYDFSSTSMRIFQNQIIIILYFNLSLFDLL